MRTLKELKKLYPELISTSGNIYLIDGMGWYKQRNTAFGLETYCKDWEGNWTRVSFEDECDYFIQLHGKR